VKELTVVMNDLFTPIACSELLVEAVKANPLQLKSVSQENMEASSTDVGEARALGKARVKRNQRGRPIGSKAKAAAAHTKPRKSSRVTAQKSKRKRDGDEGEGDGEEGDGEGGKRTAKGAAKGKGKATAEAAAAATAEAAAEGKRKKREREELEVEVLKRLDKLEPGGESGPRAVLRDAMAEVMAGQGGVSAAAAGSAESDESDALRAEKERSRGEKQGLDIKITSLQTELRVYASEPQTSASD
jgi:hypothetical protein